MSNDDILLQLKRILSSPQIVNANVLSEFLSFVVNETIAGRGRSLKEYTIAINALHKDEYFDPQIDSIVRIHASRLRRALKEYYNENGKNDPIVISIPKGCYAPKFAINEPERRALATESRGLSDSAELGIDLSNGPDLEIPDDTKFSGQVICKKTTVAIIPLTCFNRTDMKPFAKGVCEYLLAELTHHEMLEVVSHLPCQSSSGIADTRKMLVVLRPDYVLTGSVQEQLGSIRVCVQLNICETGEQVWANTFDKKKSDQTLWEFQEEVVDGVLATVTGINGMVLNHERQAFLKNHLHETVQVPLTFWYHKYSNCFDLKIIEQAKRFYENALHEQPTHPVLLSFLSEIYSGESYLVSDTISRLDIALLLARRALQNDPRCQQAHLAMAINFLLRGNSRKCIYLLDQGAAINAKSVDYKGAMGALLIYAGEFERGMPLVIDAQSLNSFLPWWHSFSLCLYYFYKECYADVIILVDRLDARTLNAMLIKASSYVELGEYERAKSILYSLESDYPALDYLDLSVLEKLFTFNPLVFRIQKSLSVVTTHSPTPFSFSNRIYT